MWSGRLGKPLLISPYKGGIKQISNLKAKIQIKDFSGPQGVSRNQSLSAYGAPVLKY